MAIIHTPRVIYSIAKGLTQQSKSKGIGITRPHKYNSRVGIFDVDYLGHMNNAAFLSHAEYARWEMTGASGMLQAMYNTNHHFLVASASVRYRAEIRPLFRNFEIQTTVSGMDDKHIWISQTFRHSQKGDDRIKAQVLVKGVTIKDRKVIDPRIFMKNEVGMDADLIDNKLSRPNPDASMEVMISHFESLEEAYRTAATIDDETTKQQSK